jgi:hypothetical protein
MTSRPSDIREIDFGLAAAEEERSTRPELLLGGFLDAHGYVRDIRDGTRFLILGRKGSGKSAIASRIQLESKDKGGLRVTQCVLSSFPYNSFSEILPGADRPEVRFTSNWELLLLFALMDSFRHDDGCTTVGSPTHSEMIEALAKLGLVPGTDLTYLVRQTSSRKLKAGLPHVLEFVRRSTEEPVNLDIRLLYSSLQDVASRTRPSLRHLLFIDGLDDVLTSREVEFRALETLVLATERLNRRLRDSGVSAKVVLLCRTDLFDQLEGPNLNKTRQDNAVVLDWYQEAREPQHSDLARLIDHRARASLGREIDVFGEFLPPTIIGDQPTINTLFDHTRHTPRDVIQLMNRVKDCAHGPVATRESVLTALGRYSHDYLVPEIRNEVSRLPDSKGAIAALTALQLLGQREFGLQELRVVIARDERFRGVEVSKALGRLFDCSAVGNLRRGEGSASYRFTFRFRNPEAQFNPNDRVVVHRGLLKALNLA